MMLSMFYFSDFTLLCVFTAHLDIMEFGQTHRRSLVEREGNTAVIECQLPRSNPPALPRYRIRGKWLEESTGIRQNLQETSRI